MSENVIVPNNIVSLEKIDRLNELDERQRAEYQMMMDIARIQYNFAAKMIGRKPMPSRRNRKNTQVIHGNQLASVD